MTARCVELNGGWVMVADAAGDRTTEAEPPSLSEVHWAITGRCNLACRHCFMEAPAARYGEVSHERALRLIEQFERAGVRAVSLTGGEPLLRDDFFEILEELAARNIRVPEIVTNGVLLTDDVLERVVAIGHEPRWKISFDGRGSHDRMRGTPGVEAVVVDVIRRVAASSADLAVGTTVDRSNVGTLEATYDLMASLRVPIWMVGRAQTTGNFRDRAMQVPTEQMADCCLRLRTRWQDDGRPIGILLDGFFAGGPASSLGRRWSAAPCDPPRYTADSYECGSCRRKAFLLPDGTLLPCTGFTGTAVAATMPNLFERELRDVWARSALREIADMKKSAVLACQPECRGCEHFVRCGAGCRAYALTEAGDLMAKDPRACALWKQGYRRRFGDAAGRASEEKS